MSDCRPRFISRFVLILVSGICLYGCASFVKTDQPDFKPGSDLQSVINEQIYCSGKGQIAVISPEKFNLTFQYQCVQDSLYLVFKDMLGRKIETLYEGMRAAGDQTDNWNAAGKSSGIYYYKIESDNFTETKKMTLLK